MWLAEHLGLREVPVQPYKANDPELEEARKRIERLNLAISLRKRRAGHGRGIRANESR